MSLFCINKSRLKGGEFLCPLSTDGVRFRAVLAAMEAESDMTTEPREPRPTDVVPLAPGGTEHFYLRLVKQTTNYCSRVSVGTINRTVDASSNSIQYQRTGLNMCCPCHRFGKSGASVGMEVTRLTQAGKNYREASKHRSRNLEVLTFFSFVLKRGSWWLKAANQGGQGSDHFFLQPPSPRACKSWESPVISYRLRSMSFFG